MKKFLLYIIAVIVTSNISSQDAIILKLPDGLAPVIDGLADSLWQEYEKFNIEKPFKDEIPTLDTATWQAVWNDTAIFVIISVQEDDFCPSWCSGAADWQSDKPEVYFDINETLKDGLGPRGSPNGHYMFAPAPTFDTYSDTVWGIGPYGEWFYGYAYVIDGADYVYEYAIPWSSLTDQFGITFNPAEGRHIGYDVTVIDRDVDDADRKRAVWMNDGKGPASDESWNNMDDCGVISFADLYYKDTIVCDTGEVAITLFDIPEDSVIDYEWNTDGGEIVAAYKNYATIKWSSTGIKNISLVITKVMGDKDTFLNKITVYPRLSVKLGEDFTICRNTSFDIIPTVENGVSPFNYIWNSQSGDSVYTGSITKTSNIELIIKDNVGCIASDDIHITIPQSIITEWICMVTVDAETGKNKVIWEKTEGIRIKEYQILKETTIAGQYVIIDTVPFIDESVYTDNESDPAKYSDRYKLVTIDSCGNISISSSPHQTIHLMISQGFQGQNNLSWSPYAGFDYNTYYIYKGSSPDNLELINSIAKTKTQYTDTASGIAYYKVAVRPNQPCDISEPGSAGDLYYEATSNIVNTVTTNINNNENIETYFELFPNPADDELIIEYSLLEPSDVIIEIYNLLGIKIHEFRRQHNCAGIFRYVVTKDILLNTGNINIVKLKLNGKVFYKKVIIN